MKTVLVTGCTGLVGHGLCSYFLNQGFQVLGTSRKKIKSLHKNFRSLEFDLTGDHLAEDFQEAIRGTDFIVHNAAKVSGGKSPVEDKLFVDSNFGGTLKLIDCVASTSDSKPFIYISGTALVASQTGTVTENDPYDLKSFYHLSKACGELAVQEKTAEKKIKGTILRVKAPYGYRPTVDAVIPKFLKLAKASQDIQLMGTGTREQIFTFVDDVARACLAAFFNKKTGLFNITGQTPITMGELARLVIEVVPDCRSKIVFSTVPDPQENVRAQVCLQKAKLELGFEPIFGLCEGLKKIVLNDYLDFFEY